MVEKLRMHIEKQTRANMREYKVEPLRFIQKGSDSNQIVTESKAVIQAKLDEYTSKGYKLTSMTAGDSGMIYLIFEKDN